MGINLQSLKYMVQGFKKVALNDTKGVLTNKNNFKWVKEVKGYNYTDTILPTGTRVREKSKVFCSPMFEDKIITKPDGTVFTRYLHGDALRITKASKTASDIDVLAHKYLA